MIVVTGSLFSHPYFINNQEMFFFFLVIKRKRNDLQISLLFIFLVYSIEKVNHNK